MKDILDKDLENAIRNLERMQNKSDSNRCSERGNDHRQRQDSGRDNWDDQEEEEQSSNWDTGADCENDSTSAVIQRPGAHKGRVGNLFDGFASGITPERVLEAVLLAATVGGIIWIILNFEAITWILAGGIAYIVITIGKFIIVIMGVVGCVLFAGFRWRSRRRRRRRW